MTTTLYVPGTEEKDPKKLIMSQQLVAGQVATNTDNIATNTTNIATNTTNIATNTTKITALQNTNTTLQGSPIHASLAADVLLNNTANYFDGPSIAQGTSGTWFVSGTITVFSSNQDNIGAKLWDGTTVIASAVTTTQLGLSTSISLSGFITSPAGNLRISARDFGTTAGKMTFNSTGLSKDCTISAYRIA